MNAADEFVVGKHGIGYVDSYLFQRAPAEFDAVESLGSYKVLSRYMSDSEIEFGLKPGLCTLGDVLAFLDNAPEECKDGYSNLFYLEKCVVGVRWLGGRWLVHAWRRGIRWFGSIRVFSPVTDPSSLSTLPCDTLALPKILIINGEEYHRKV